MLGATSLVGSHFVQAGSFTCAAAGREDPGPVGLAVKRFTKVDLNRPDEVHEVVRSAPEMAVVNFAARTDVDSVERERSAPGAPGGPAWTVNALAPEAIASACRAGSKYFVQVSTDFVFDGTAGPYGEAAPPSPFSEKVSWYGWTKSGGERQSMEANPDTAVLRISYPYRVAFPGKLDFARWMLEKHRQGSLPPLYGNQRLTPTWIPDVTSALEVMIRRQSPGIFHVASPEVTTPLEFGRVLLTRVEGSTPSLAEGFLEAPKPGSGSAPRPIQGGLRSNRGAALGIRATTWRVGIERLARGDEGRP